MDKFLGTQFDGSARDQGIRQKRAKAWHEKIA